MTKPVVRILAIVLLMAVALTSILVLSRYTASPDFYASSLQKLDEQKMNAMMLSSVVTVVSTAISAPFK